MFTDKKYKIVILENIFENANSFFGKYFFPKIIHEKKRGYHHSHTNNYLPMGQDDYICSFITVCEELNGDYVPICLAKVVPYSRCQYYNVPFPMLELLKGHMNENDFMAIENTIQDLADQNLDFTYSGGWTMNPDYRGNSETGQILRELYTACHYLLHEKNNYHSFFGFGCPRFKTDKFFKSWGVEVMKNNDQEIGTIYSPNHNGEEILSMHGIIDNMSDWKKAMADKYFSLWNERIEISADTLELSEKLAKVA